ncbi:MAG: ankyrin repeat domain-containing protein [Planctomycetota bacterium]
MEDNSKQQQLISRRRHYFYVLVFSVAVWLFVATPVGGALAIYDQEMCGCKLHETYINISFLFFTPAAILFGLIFSYPLHRFMLVSYSKPGDKKITTTWMAALGKTLLGKIGLALVIILPILYMLADYISHSRFRIHPTEKSRQHANAVLHCAAFKGYTAIVKSVLAEGRSVNELDEQGRTPLIMASYSGKTVTVRFLLKNGADVSIRGPNGRTALGWAIRNYEEETVNILFDHGAKIPRQPW